MKGRNLAISLGFVPRFVGKGRAGVRFQMVMYTTHRNGNHQTKTWCPKSLLTEEQVRAMGYDTDLLITRALTEKEKGRA